MNIFILCVSVCMCVHKYLCRLEEGVRAPGGGEVPDVSAVT